MSSITDLLAAILAAKKGEEVRGSIHDAIELCYEDGRAGVNDLQARQLIEAVAAVNEEQATALEVLQARVEELESGEGGSSQQSTTIDIPTVLVDGGVVENVSVNNNSTTTRHITFTTEFTETPKVMVAIGKNAGAVSQYGYLSANILYPTVSKTGFDFFLANRTGSDRSPGVVWYAYQPTVKTIDLDITIPETEGMTEAEVREITGPIAAAVDALKTGYDGTTYQTAAEAIRTQINYLHVLIGDEPGTAINASAIGYGEDSNVADELDGLNERLDQLDGGLTADIKAALMNVVSHIAIWTDENGQSYIDALQTALYPPANLLSISAVYTQVGEVYNNDTLDSLKSDLVVTARYDDGTTSTIQDYTLSGDLVVGTSTITVTYGGKSSTFSVTVTKAPVRPIHEWDLTDSLTDKIGGIVADTTATQGTTGLVFDTANTYCDFGAIYQSGRMYELDIAEIGEKVSGSQPRRLFMADTDANTAYGGGSGLILKNTAWSAYSGSSWLTISNNTMSGIEYFNGKTLRVYVDTDMIWHMYAKVTGSDTEFTPIGETPSAMCEYTNGHVYIGGNKDDAIGNTRVTGLRVYEGEID